MDTKPVLSVGIIFKNEIRCLERCLKSLEPLRAALPCEVVMADTGSSDGSREVAAKYADILFDFPWINDFAAARNAVMDRCSGEWYMGIDADEWLDEDVTQLAGFLSDRQRWQQPFCGIMIRNYFTQELDEEYSDFFAVRLSLMSTGVRYVGAIHELWNHSGNVTGLIKTIFHHDGYVNRGAEKAKEKQDRNMTLLREALERNPDDLKTLLQCIESGKGSSSFEGYIRQAVAGVEKKLPMWQSYGPPILRFAVLHAAIEDLPELEKWIAWARDWFPNSPYINVDVAYMAFVTYAEKKEYAKAIPFGEQYLRSIADYRAGKFDYTALIVSSLSMASRFKEDIVRIVLADAYFYEKQFQKAQEMLLSVDQSQIQPNAVGNYMGVLMNLHAQSGEDLSPVMTGLWKSIEQAKKKEHLRAAVLKASAVAFSPDHRQAEDEGRYTHAYTMFLPLAGQCGLGTAAAILESNNQLEMENLLRTVDNWDELPIVALEQALTAGVEFPQAGCPLTLEQMDSLAARLAQSSNCLSSLLDGAVRSMDRGLQPLFWARGLALAAIGANGWKDGEDGLDLAKTFAAVEKAVLPQYYAADMLCDDNIEFLPPLHRFGWYCAQAFDALDSGDAKSYVRYLREGLSTCEGMKDMVEFLIQNTPELQAPKPSAELLALAEQVRTMLAAYDPGDPAVMALKQSPVYQKVAYLIEGIDGGGLPS